MKNYTAVFRSIEWRCQVKKEEDLKITFSLLSNNNDLIESAWMAYNSVTNHCRYEYHYLIRIIPEPETIFTKPKYRIKAFFANNEDRTRGETIEFDLDVASNLVKTARDEFKRTVVGCIDKYTLTNIEIIKTPLSEIWYEDLFAKWGPSKECKPTQTLPETISAKAKVKLIQVYNNTLSMYSGNLYTPSALEKEIMETTKKELIELIKMKVS